MGKIKKKGRASHMLGQRVALILYTGASGQAKNFMYVWTMLGLPNPYCPHLRLFTLAGSDLDLVRERRLCVNSRYPFQTFAAYAYSRVCGRRLRILRTAAEA